MRIKLILISIITFRVIIIMYWVVNKINKDVDNNCNRDVGRCNIDIGRCRRRWISTKRI